MKLLKFGLVGLSLSLISACQIGNSAQTGTLGTDDDTPALAGAGQQCSIDLPNGPPAKPRRNVDFATSTGRNLGKGVGRGMIAGAGVSVAGPVGGVVAGNLAARTIRSDYDLQGAWRVTDGAPNCGCTLNVASTVNLIGSSAAKGELTPSGCSNPRLASVASWAIEESMTGYDADLTLYGSNGFRIAALKRDGHSYYSGKLTDGTPITIWRN